jgi:TonB family protein
MSDSLPVAVPPPERPSPGHTGDQFISLRLGDSRATEHEFELDRFRRRYSRSAVVSIALHVGAVLLFVVVSTIAPALSGTEPLQPNQQTPISMVWLPVAGPGGGGGGGGNRSPEPPRKLEMPGRDKISMPVSPPPKLTPPKQEAPEPPPVQGVSVPAMTMASGLETIPGTPDGTGPPDSTSLGPGSGGGAGTGRGTGIGPGEGSGLGPGSGGGTGGGVYRPGAGITLPRPIREVKPQYTAEAMRAKIQGEVWLEAVVMPDGTVGKVEIVRSLDSVFGLDQEAIKAAKQWRFAPGTRQGEPVPVLVTISMTFTLR